MELAAKVMVLEPRLAARKQHGASSKGDGAGAKVGSQETA